MINLEEKDNDMTTMPHSIHLYDLWHVLELILEISFFFVYEKKISDECVCMQSIILIQQIRGEPHSKTFTTLDH